jgi:hypothetical protein
VPKTAAPLAAPSRFAAFGRAFTNTLAQPSTIAMLAAPLIGAGVGALELRHRASQAAVQKATAYREMMDLHPHLERRDPGEVNRIYNSLYNVSPTMAVDPMVAGAWVDNVIESKGVGYNSHQGLLTAVKELSGIEHSVAETRNARSATPFAQGTSKLVREMGGQFDKGGKKGLKGYLDQRSKEINDILDERNTAFDTARSNNNVIFKQRNAELAAREAALEAREKKSSSSELGQLFDSLGI